MKNYSLYGLAIFVCLFIFSACTKDLDKLTTIETIPTPSVKVSASFIGLIVDEQAVPVVDAMVKIGSENGITDENGFFKLSGLFDNKGTVIEVEKDGFFNAYGNVIPVKDGTVQVRFILKARTNTNIASSSKVYVHTADNFQVSFQEDAYQNLQKETYTGEVTIQSTFLDPSSDKFSNEYVGNLIGTSEQKANLIQPFGIINLELFSDNGTPLQINKSANITMKVPAAFRDKVPSEASLWYLDTDSGVWIEEGTATLNGDFYEGTVDHFTNWCLGTGIPFETSTLSGKITQQGNPYPNARLGLSYNPVLRSEYYADENGNYVIEVLNEQDFKLELLDDCRTVLTSITEPVGISSDREINIEVPLTANSFSISGTLTDCEENPVANGYVLVSYQGNDFNQVILADENGQYKLSFENCNSDNALVKGFDPTSDLTSPNVEIEGSGVYDLPTCATAFQGELIFTIDGEEPYIIKNCSFTKERTFVAEVEVDEYTIKALDLFPTYPSVTGIFADYTIIFFIKVGNTGPFPPGGPMTLPEISGNPPIVFTFPPIYPNPNSISDDFIDVSFEYEKNSQFTINRSLTGINDLFANGNTFSGSVQIQAILQE